MVTFSQQLSDLQNADPLAPRFPLGVFPFVPEGYRGDLVVATLLWLRDMKKSAKEAGQEDIAQKSNPPANFFRFFSVPFRWLGGFSNALRNPLSQRTGCKKSKTQLNCRCSSLAELSPDELIFLGLYMKHEDAREAV